jgi:hypothetical protein
MDDPLRKIWANSHPHAEPATAMKPAPTPHTDVTVRRAARAVAAGRRSAEDAGFYTESILFQVPGVDAVETFMPDPAHILANTSRALFDLILVRGAKVMSAKREAVEKEHGRFEHLFKPKPTPKTKVKSKGEKWEGDKRKRKSPAVTPRSDLVSFVVHQH